MPTGAEGTTITLTGRYQDGTGTAVTPITPLITIKNPLGVDVVTDDVPTFSGQTGLYDYDFAILLTGPTGAWTAVWSGIINGAGVEASEVFSVVEAGDIVFPETGCIPMWATANDFIAANPGITITEDEANELIIEATWLLSGLVGDRYHVAQSWIDTYEDIGTCKIQTRHYPIHTVREVVKINLNTLEETEVDFLQLSTTEVRVCCKPGRGSLFWRDSPLIDQTPCQSCKDVAYRVTYDVGNNLPPGTKRQVLKLAREFWKSGQGMSCSLPERVTNISRQGVSWTVLDPLDFLDKGLTGIGSIDQWISRLNLRGYATMIDPLKNPPMLFSELTGCEPVASGGG